MNGGWSEMHLLIVRHGDPDYENDSLTEKGWREAALLADRLSQMDIKAFYVSPYGRAKATASCTLKKMHRKATVCQWMREFWPRIERPDTEGDQDCCWDWLPENWTADERFYQLKTWALPKPMKDAGVEEAYRGVCASFDRLLAHHGYVRRGKVYHVTESNHDTIVLFCHFGAESIMLSHLLSVSPMIFWQGFSASPASVTSVYTEERREGTAAFRINTYGDLSHLYAAGEAPSFAVRFCECYDDNERHD